MVTAKGGILGLFTEHGLHGGIQASGRIAWQGVVQQQPQDCFYFCYGEPPPAMADTALIYPANETAVSSYLARTRIAATKQALSRTWPVQTVFVWHLHLLKLLPFFRLPSAKVILFLHGIEAWRKLPWLERNALRRVSLFLSNSDFTWQHFLQFNPEFRSYPQQTLPLGIGSEQIDPTSAPAVTPVTLMISRLVKGEDYKGHREIIRVWPLVLQQLPEAELWIVGEGNLKEELQVLTRQNGVEQKIRFLGWVTETRKQELLEQCRCLALPSRAEGFGLVYLEAMRIGRPCLVSMFDAAREVVNPPEAGLAVDPGQKRELADALCRLMSPGAQWNAWSAQARRRYEMLFTAKHFQTRLVKVLSELSGT